MFSQQCSIFFVSVDASVIIIMGWTGKVLNNAMLTPPNPHECCIIITRHFFSGAAPASTTSSSSSHIGKLIRLFLIIMGNVIALSYTFSWVVSRIISSYMGRTLKFIQSRNDNYLLLGGWGKHHKHLSFTP